MKQEGVNKSFLKKLALSLSVLILMLLFISACGDNNETSTNKNNDDEINNESKDKLNINKNGFPIVDEQIEISVMAPGTGMEQWDNMVTLQEYEKKTNVKMNYNTPPVNDFQTKLNLAFASGDLADIIYAAGSNNLTSGMEVDYGQQGVLIPLEDLIAEYAPNIQKILEENPDIKKSITTIDGHIYSLPKIDNSMTSSWASGPMWYNGQWLDALDVEEVPKTTDELYDLLIRFRDEDPNGNGKSDEIPLIDIQDNNTAPWLIGAFGMKERGIEEFDGKVRYSPVTDNFKEYLTYMNKLYEEGLMDTESFSQTNDQKQAKGKENKIGLFQGWFSYFNTGETEGESINNPMFHPLTSSISEEFIIPKSYGIERGTFAITSNNEHPEASIRWIDYFYSQEGFEYLHEGPEGHLWTEENNSRTYLDVPDEFDNFEDYRATVSPDYGISTPTLSGEIEGKEQSEFDKFIVSETEEKIEPYAEMAYPLVYLTKEEQKEVNAIEADLESYVEQMEAKFITGVEPLESWDEYVETIEHMNLERYVEIYQDAYDRWDAN